MMRCYHIYSSNFWAALKEYTYLQAALEQGVALETNGDRLSDRMNFNIILSCHDRNITRVTKLK